jgi:hypothetical protein
MVRGIAPAPAYSKAPDWTTRATRSLACAYLLRDHLHRMTIYHVSTGDQLQEVIDIVDHVRGMAPNFVTIRTDKEAWVRQHGLPSDLVPHSSHLLGQEMRESPVRLVSRYDCCFHNLMLPNHERIKADGNTLIIRGTKLSDMKRVPFRSGEVKDGVELFLPIEDWDDARLRLSARGGGADRARLCRGRCRAHARMRPVQRLAE